jgi:hypothetical protein
VIWVFGVCLALARRFSRSLYIGKTDLIIFGVLQLFDCVKRFYKLSIVSDANQGGTLRGFEMIYQIAHFVVSFVAMIALTVSLFVIFAVVGGLI